jgi:hypothetical protein
MARMRPRVSKTTTSRSVDDFQQIKGIGPALAGKLQAAGINTFQQLASLSPARLVARVPSLSASQIIRKDWIGQARKLASRKSGHKNPKEDIVNQTTRQHYENFTIEFLLDEKNGPRRTRVVHVQSGDADTWLGWEDAQLIGFLTRHAKLNIPAVNLVKTKNPAIYKKAAQRPAQTADPTSIQASPPPTLFPPEPAFAQPAPEPREPVLQIQNNIQLAGTLKLRDLRAFLTDSTVPALSVQQVQPYFVCLTLDLSDITIPDKFPLTFTATVNFMQLGGQYCHTLEKKGALTQGESIILKFPGPSLESGVFRLDAFARLKFSESGPNLTAYLRGDLIQIY